MFNVIPACDIRDGKCVRLTQGDYQQETIYSESPVEVCTNFAQLGAKRLHLVDLDGALKGKTMEGELIKRIVNSVSVPVEVGGGIRDLRTIETYLNQGIHYVILGTVAKKKPELVKEAFKNFGDAVIIGIDCKDELVSTEGWTETSQTHYSELVQKMEDLGAHTFIMTDIAKDGMLTGPNVDFYKDFLNRFKTNLIASGGISSMMDIETLDSLSQTYNHLIGVIVGKAIYDGRINLNRLLEKY